MSSERETRDFMRVDSFSQLPFIRTREKTTPTSSAAIRLFGIEVPQDPTDYAQKESSSSTTTTITDNVNANSNGPTHESGRKFECHYCCRNFPTSQALGGHQNAHKRERQHAKRIQFQSAIAAHQHHHHHHHHQPSYSLLNYHRALSGAVSSPHSGHYFPSWIDSSTTTSSSSPHTARFYGGPGSMSEPINGSPLPAWRVNPQSPGVTLIQRDRMMPLPSRPAMGAVRRAVLGTTTTSYYGSSSSFSPPSVQATVKDSLSLDLHL